MTGIMGTGDPQSLGSVEWISYRFNELNENDLFYFTQNIDGMVNPSYRKLNDNEALLLNEQKVINIDPNTRVHQKEY